MQNTVTIYWPNQKKQQLALFLCQMMIATTVKNFIFIGFSILFLTNNSVRISPSSSYANQLNRSYPYYRQDLPILNFVSTDLLALILLAAFLCGGDPDLDHPKGTQPLSLFAILRSSMFCREVGRVQSWLGDLS